MKKLIFLLAMAFSFVSLHVSANAPIPVVTAMTLNWPQVIAKGINVHRGDGSYVETIPANATSWTATTPGSYFLVATQNGPWQDWFRSETVTILDTQVDVLMPTVNGNTLSWPLVAVAGINVHRGDGSYVETIPGNATSWTALESGSYYLVATDTGHWSGWLRSATVTIQGSTNTAAPMPVANGSQLVWPLVAATGINVHRGDGSYVETIPGNATSWTALESGTYYLVATDSGEWLNWPRSSNVSVTVGETENPFSQPAPSGSTVVARLGYPAARDAVDELVSMAYLNVYFELEDEILTGNLHSSSAPGTLDCPGGGTVSCLSNGCIFPLSELSYDNCVVEGRTLSGSVERRGISFPFASGGSMSLEETFDNFSIDAGSDGTVAISGNVKRTVVDSQSEIGLAREIIQTKAVEATINSARIEIDAGVHELNGNYNETTITTSIINTDGSISSHSILNFGGQASIQSTQFGENDTIASKTGELLVTGMTDFTGVPAILSADFGDTSTLVLTTKSDSGDSVQIDIVSDNVAVSFDDVYQFEPRVTPLK